MDKKEITKPFIIAHRGFSGLYPQNTLIAFEKAADLGVDFIELDVSLSKDNHAIVFHDSEVSRLTDGGGYVKDMSLAQIRKLDAGIKFNKKFQGAKIPTLPEVIETIGDSGVNLCVEIKARDADKRDNVEEIVVQILREYDYLNKTMFTSYNCEVVKGLSEMCPNNWVGLDPSSEQAKTCSVSCIVDLCQKWNATALEFEHNLLTKDLVDLAHNRGLQVHAWTVDKADGMKRLVRMNVDGILTNRPDILKRILNEASVT
jgi:glycerophosphoryl diester phosphodiesterase